MAKVLIATGDAGESLEILYPYSRLKEEGHEVKIAAPTKKKLNLEVHDFVEGWDTSIVKLGYNIQADLSFKEVNPQECDVPVLPGGRAPEWIRYNEDLQRIVRHFFGQNKPVAAICHAPGPVR